MSYHIDYTDHVLYRLRPTGAYEGLKKKWFKRFFDLNDYDEAPTITIQFLFHRISLTSARGSSTISSARRRKSLRQIRAAVTIVRELFRCECGQHLATSLHSRKTHVRGLRKASMIVQLHMYIFASVSSDILKCRLLKRLLDRPMKNSPRRGA